MNEDTQVESQPSDAPVEAATPDTGTQVEGESTDAAADVPAADPGVAPAEQGLENTETGTVEIAASGDQPAHPVPAEDAPDAVAPRDPSVPVAADEEITEQEKLDRENYVAANPDERTAHDPYPADGEPV